MAGKTRKKKMSKTVRKLLLILCFVIFLNAVVVMAIVFSEDRDEHPPNQLSEEMTGTAPSSAVQPPVPTGTEPEETEETTESVPQVNPIALPYAVEEGELVIESLFQFTGLNPDCGNQQAVDVAAIQMTNTSERHLASADLTVTMSDGTIVEFAACDIPAGMSVMVFAKDNTAIGGDIACIQVDCDAVFEDSPTLMDDKVEITVEGTEITVKNISGGDLNQITVYCHSVLDKSYFGGITYQYVIDSVPAGGSAAVTAVDCILGLTDVVRIEIGS